MLNKEKITLSESLDYPVVIGNWVWNNGVKIEQSDFPARNEFGNVIDPNFSWADAQKEGYLIYYHPESGNLWFSRKD